jgi:hypothetical protein
MSQYISGGEPTSNQRRRVMKYGIADDNRWISKKRFDTVEEALEYMEQHINKHGLARHSVRVEPSPECMNEVAEVACHWDKEKQNWE